jgi:hypothetical protein
MSYPTDYWPVDGHVHFHTLERVEPTLDAAAANFSRVGARSRRGLAGAILLAQGTAESVYEELASMPHAGHWRVAPGRDEPGTLIARRDGVSLAIVCGRQVRAEDGLEVLALGTTRVFADGLPFKEVIAAARATDALVVIPWGFGKWLGRRAQRVETVLGIRENEGLFVGDNGSRMELFGVPRLIRELERRGYRVLRGSDPFPLGGDHRRVGQFGFLADVEFDEAAPWRRLRDWLVSQSRSPVQYGRASGPVRCIVNQVGIQLYNGRRRRRGP